LHTLLEKSGLIHYITSRFEKETRARKWLTGANPSFHQDILMSLDHVNNDVAHSQQPVAEKKNIEETNKGSSRKRKQFDSFQGLL